MATIFDKWNKNIDTDALKKDIAEVEQNKGGNFEEVPDGQYEVEIEKMELVESKKGDPMVSIWFNILDGDFKGHKIFMNQVITKGFQIHIMNQFLRDLDAVDSDEVEFKDYSQYNDLILDIFEAVSGNLQFLLQYGTNKKGYHTYKIEEVFDVE